MLIAFLFVLSAATVNGLPDDHHGPRRTKQLGLRDAGTFSNEDQDKNPPAVNGYLPPASPSSPPTILGAQSLQTFDFQPLNSLERENELCKSPSCDSNNGSFPDSKIPKPSRDLMPPFNDLDQEKAPPTGSISLQQEFTTRRQTEFPTTTPTPTTTTTTTTTTEKLATASSVQVTTRIISKISKPETTAKAFSSRAEATNELRTYLPPQPEFSAAAQTNVAVVRPSGPTNDHDHHHGHDHGKDFDICADAFHSFLCAPLKARKRITGAFPDSLRGQSSFIKYQQLLPNFEREPAPSNTLPSAYLPPKRTSFPTNILSTTRPVVTPTVPSRPPPKTIPESSNSKHRFYLPPITDNKIVPVPSTKPVFRPAPPKPTPSSAPITTLRTTISTAFTNPLLTRTPAPIGRGSSHVPIFNFLPSNDNRFYLPPSINPKPAPSFTATSTISPPRPSVPSSLPAVTTPNSISTTGKPQPLFTKPSTTAKPQPSTAATASSSSQVPTRVPPSLNPQSQAKPLPYTKKPPKFTGQPSNEDRSYLPPDTNLAAAAQTNSATAALAPKNPFHHGRDLCTDPFHSFLCVSAKPRKRITGQLPSGVTGDSSNTQESRLKPESTDQTENKPPLEGASAQNLGYKYPKPNQLPAVANVIPSAASASAIGYTYPKSDKVFTLPSQQKPIAVPTITTTSKPEPHPSEARVVSGYQYPKPDTSFPLPGEQTKVPATTTSPTTGYSYPKPQKPFPLPTEQKEVVEKPKQRPPSPKADLASPTTQSKGYQYPKPEQGLKLPEKTTGYSYPKPTKRLELPTESRFQLPTNSNLDPLGALGSADFIPVNKLNFKRSESKLVAGLRRFGERQKKRLRETYTARTVGE